MSNKLCTLSEAIARIPDGALLALGGNTLNRAPMAAACELAWQKKRRLQLVKTAGAMDVDLLCLAGCVSSVAAGFVSFESHFGLCRHYRRAVEKGAVQAREHACYTVISALRAAVYGLPFMPVRGLQESELIAANPYFARVQDPFSGEWLAAVQAIRPDWAILHVHAADELGNARIDGPWYEDLLMARAARQVLITTEQVVDSSVLRRDERKAQIPHFLVQAVVQVKGGAAPSACAGCYGPDDAAIERYLRLETADELPRWLDAQRRTWG